MKPKTFIILGTHRSGTTLVAKLVKAFGVPLEDDGAGEPSALRNANEALIGWWQSPQLQYRPDVVNTIHKWIDRQNANDIWAFKDPRCCMTLPLFIDAIRNPYIICTHRLPTNSAKSLVMRSSISFDTALDLMTQHLKARAEFLQAHPTFPRCDLSYDALLDDTKAELAVLSDFLGRPITPSVRDIIKPDYRHFVS